MKITFRVDDHSYYVNGRRVPHSVTEVLREEGLVNYDDAPQIAVHRAGKLGQHVHAGTALLDRGTLDPDYHDETVLAYLRGWESFKVDNGIESIPKDRIECLLYSKALNVAGTADRILTVNGKMTVIEIKTYAVPTKVTGLQLAAYRRMALEMKLEKRIERRIEVVLNPSYEAGYKVIPHTDPTDESAFIAALTMVNWRKKWA